VKCYSRVLTLHLVSSSAVLRRIDLPEQVLPFLISAEQTTQILGVDLAGLAIGHASWGGVFRATLWQLPTLENGPMPFSSVEGLSNDAARWRAPSIAGSGPCSGIHALRTALLAASLRSRLYLSPFQAKRVFTETVVHSTAEFVFVTTDGDASPFLCDTI
jgi:hypothetical protein